MNKKILLKITVSILACMSFALISNHMPNLMQAVYQAIFGEFDHIALAFVLGLFIFEIIVLRYLGKDIRCWYFCLGTVIIAAFLVLFAGDTNYTDKLSPGANTTLLYSVLVDGNAEELGREKVFAEYYFDGKNLIVSEQEKDNEKHRYLYTMAVPARRVVVGQESVISEDAAKMILSYPFRDFDSDYFVIDEFWEHTRNIKMAEWGDRYIFCSEELFDAVLNHSNDIVLSGEGIDLFAYAENGSFREVKQTFIILILLMIGAAIVLPLWGRDYPYLALFLSLPVGAAVWCIACVALMIFNIPYNILTVTVCVVLGVGIRLFRQWNKLKELDRAICFQFILLAFVVTYFFACFKICNIYSDSATRCTYAYHMAIFGSMRDVLEYIAPFGMLEPTIMSMGYLFRCDAVYVFYPLMAICDIGIMCAGFYYINNKKCNYMAIAALGTGILLLITNFDFVYSAVVMAVHGPTAVYFLIFFVIILMKKKINIARFEWLVVIAATVILLTRIEGAVYVMFFLALTLGMEDSSLKMNRIILAVAGILIVWNVFQMIVIGNDGDPTFWTPQRGMLLIAGALLVVVASWFFSKPWSWLDYLKRHYFLILVGGVCLATIFTVIFVKRDIGSANLPFYLSHFSNNERMNDRINAGAIWTFILLLCPIVIKNGKSTEKYIVSMILGYIVLIYFICLFRAEVWLHYGYYDSGRKTLVQIMPAAIWLLACSVGDKENLIKKKMKNGVNSKFVEGLIWNYGSVVILSISGFLINFLIICFYDAAALGVFSRAQAWYGVLSQITVWGVHMSVMRLIPEYQDARREQEMILSSAMAGVLMFSVVCVGMIELLLPRIITEHGRLLTSMQILMPGLVFFSLNKILLNYLNGLSMMKSYAFFQSLRYLVIVVIVWVMGALQCDYKWLTASFTGAELVVLAACVGYLIHRGLFIRHPGLKYLKRHASFGTRILLSNLVNELNTKVDIICLGFFVGDDYLIGIYSFAVLFAEGFYQLYFVVRRSINPKITEYYVRDTLKEGIGMLNSGLKRALRVASPLAFAALLTGYYVICCLLQRKEYLSGLTFLIVICLAIVVSGRKIILGNIFAQTSFPAIESLFNLITVISNFILNVIFILWLGLMGAAVATALSYLIYGHLLKYYVKKKFGIAI